MRKDDMDSMKLREDFKDKVKNTVGYLEAEDKESFMIGAGVAISKVSQHYQKQINRLEYQIECLKKEEALVRSFFNQMSTLKNKYDNQEG